MNDIKKHQKGFTLIELMVAASIFIIIMTVSMGSLLGVFDANRKARSLKAVMNNINLAVESLSKEMRYGTNYHCGSSGTLTSPQNCAAGDTFVTFLSSDGDQITYRLNNGTFEKDVDSAGYLPVIAPEVTIDSLTFYVLGAAAGDTLQPRVIVKIKGHAGVKDRADFTLETLISQRQLDS